jgi:hypothetical protein
MPMANGFELRQSLEDRGVPVEMTIYGVSDLQTELPLQNSPDAKTGNRPTATERARKSLPIIRQASAPAALWRY